MHLPSDDDKVTTVITRRGARLSPTVERMIAQGAEHQSNEHRRATFESIKREDPSTSFKSMRDLYGTMKGQTVFLCGSGPSLRACPSKLPGPTFALNRAIIQVAADYWCFSDMESWRLYGESENAKAATKCFGSGMHLFFKGMPAYLIEAIGKPSSFPAWKPLYWSCATFSWALHWLLKMEPARIILIGCDFSTEPYFDGYEQKGYEGEMREGLFKVAQSRMWEMFGPDKAEWFDPSIPILDASHGCLPLPKTRLEEWL